MKTLIFCALFLLQTSMKTTKSYAIPSIKTSDAKYVQFDSSIFDKKIKNLKYRLLEKDNQIVRLNKQIESLQLNLDQASNKLHAKPKEQDLESIKDTFYKELIALNNAVDSFKATRGYSERISSSKSIAEDIDQLENVELQDLVKMRDILQNILKLERNLADTLLEVKIKVPEGFYNITAKDMSSRWNQDMNTFVAVLFELTKRHYVDQLNEANLMRIKYTQQQNELSRFHSTEVKTKSDLHSDEIKIADLQKEISEFKKGKAHIYQEVNNVLKSQYDYKLKRTKYDYDRLSESEEKLIRKLKTALKEDNKTIVKLSNSIVTLYNKYQDFQTEIKTLRDEIEVKNDQLTKLYTYFKEEKIVLDKNQQEERNKMQTEIKNLRQEENTKEKKVEDLFIENKKITTKYLETDKNNSSLQEKAEVMSLKAKNLETKYMTLMNESENERKTYMDSIDKQRKEMKDIKVQLQNTLNENAILNKLNTKLKDERKKLYESIITKNNEVNAALASKYLNNNSGMDDLNSKLDNLEKDRSNNNDFYSTSKPVTAQPRFNQIKEDTEIYERKDDGPYADWKDAVKLNRFKEKNDNDDIKMDNE